MKQKNNRKYNHPKLTFLRSLKMTVNHQSELSDKNREKTNYNIRNETDVITIDITSIIQNYYKQIYSNKFSKLHSIDPFQEKTHTTKIHSRKWIIYTYLFFHLY